MKQEELIKVCSDLLYKLCDLVESRNTLNYYDINISSEYFFIPLLNQVFDCDLKNLNTEKKNAKAIDLYDVNGKLSVQVTSDSSAKKIRDTLIKYRDNNLYKKYQRLIFVVIVRSHIYRADFTNDIDGKFIFSKSRDIYTIGSLIKSISALSVEKIENIKDYLEFQLGTLLDKSKVLSIEQTFDYVSKNTNNVLGESFFEIDNESFIQDFQKKLEKSNAIHLSSLSVEEGKYCILNLLHKICTNKMIYVIKSKENWDKAGRHLSNCILIPDFQEDEIPVVENNTVIFIHNEGSNPNTLRIPQRTMRFLSNKLRENGYDDTYNLLNKTHGLYYYIKSELFTGQLSHPNWEKDNDKAVIVAALLGKWTESEGDKEIIEKLYGGSYEKFLSYLIQYIEVEDAYIVRKRDMSLNVIYELANPFLAVYSHRSVVDLPIIEYYFDAAKAVISERDPIFDEPFEMHFYVPADKKSRYSYLIKSGMIRTLILLALYAEYQDTVSYFVKDLLKMIHSINDWAYISRFIENLGEAAPDEVIDCLENNIDNHTGLLDLFTVEKPDILMGSSCYYVNILWCLERLLPCRDYVVRVVEILFKLGDNIDKCSIGNSPQDDISKVFCTWYNVSALELEEKIELAKIGAEKYPFFWDILYNEIEKNTTTILGNPSFTYRETDNIIPYTNADLHRLSVAYAQILISNIDDNPERLIKLSDLLPVCTDAIFSAIQNEITTAIAKFGDSDKEKIKTALRKIVCRHRSFPNSKWAGSEERIAKIEKICLGITFDDQAFDFLYLTESGEIPIFNPVAYDSVKWNYRENEEVVKGVIAAEITRFKETGIELGHFLGLRKIESYNMGAIIAKYYCDSKYDQGVLDIIIHSTNSPQIAVDYVYNCLSSGLSEVYQTIEYLREDHFADEFYVAFISALPFDEKSKLLVDELPDEAKGIYWGRSIRYKIENKDLLAEVVANLLKYGNWNGLGLIMYSQIEMFNTEELLAIISEFAQKINIEKVPVGNGRALINQLFSAVHKRIGNNLDNYPQLFELEMILFGIIKWGDMKCCQYMFQRNANLFAEILSLIYVKDDGSYDERIPAEKMHAFYTLERDIKFCPGEENDSINKDILNKWVCDFKSQLERQNQASLFYGKLGELFACSPAGSDGICPHETIREKIEELGNEKLINSFALAIMNGRGVHAVTGGKDEYKLGQKYAEISTKLSIRYPKTARIYSIISKNYFNESERERKMAETEIY